MIEGNIHRRERFRWPLNTTGNLALIIVAAGAVILAFLCH